MMPVGANGDSAPACAPLPTMIAMRNGGIAARVPTRHRHRRQHRRGGDVARAERRDEPASTKNITGMSPALPRQMRTAACATRSSVPFSCACVKSSVTPASVRNSCVGKAAQHFVRASCRRDRRRRSTPAPGQHADVQLSEAADDHRDDERAEREPGQIHHRAPSIEQVERSSSTAGCTAVVAGEVVNLMAAATCRRRRPRRRRACCARRGTACARRWRARRRSARGRSRTSRPCRSSRRRDRRPSCRECVDSSAFAGATSPIDFWWQWPCSRMRRRARLAAAARRRARRRTPRTARWPLATTSALPSRLAAQQRRRVLAHRRQAARLAEDDRPAGGGVVVEQVGVARRQCARVGEQPLRDLRPAAAAVAAPAPGRSPAADEHVERGEADLRVVVVGERVDEEQHVMAPPSSGRVARARASVRRCELRQRVGGGRCRAAAR